MQYDNDRVVFGRELGARDMDAPIGHLPRERSRNPYLREGRVSDFGHARAAGPLLRWPLARRNAYGTEEQGCGSEK